MLCPNILQFRIYEKHFAIDFPFFHKRTFLDSLEQASTETSAESKSATPPAKRTQQAPLLLAFLTQTARFHPELVKHGGSPSATAKFYAQATRLHIGSIPDRPTLELVQAHLMLGFHEWTNGEGDKGFLRARLAMSCAQVLGYQHDADLDNHDSAMLQEADADKDQFIIREIQRRTFWSCFCMDRYLSMGENRPQMFRVEDVNKVQLVCTDDAFKFGQKVKTRLLWEDDTAYARRRHGLCEANKRLHDEANTNSSERPRNALFDDIRWEIAKEADLNLCIHAVDLLGDICRWALAKGRR